MVFKVRCFKCGAHDVRLIMGNQQILHAQCHHCQANLLAEVMSFEEDARLAQRRRTPHTTSPPDGARDERP